jgi:hypothetical protein
MVLTSSDMPMTGALMSIALDLPCFVHVLPFQNDLPLRQQHQNHRIPPQEHLTNEPILIHNPTLLPLRIPRRLTPHLLHILQHHIEVSIKRLYARKQLPVVPTRDEDLAVGAHGGLQDGEWAHREFVLFDERDLVFSEVGAGFVHKFSVRMVLVWNWIWKEGGAYLAFASFSAKDDIVDCDCGGGCLGG